jgi:hypothetical protein
MNDKESYPPKTNLGGIGRTNFIKEKEAETANTRRDISEIDREEGDMDNGTTGGNFDQDDLDKNKEDQTS